MARSDDHMVVVVGMVGMVEFSGSFDFVGWAWQVWWGVNKSWVYLEECWARELRVPEVA